MPTPATPSATREPGGDGSRRAAFGRGAAGGLGYAGLTILAFPPVGAWFLAPFAVLPLLWVATRAGSRRFRAAGATLGALPFWLISQGWVREVSAAGYVPLALYLASWTGVFVWMLARVRSRGRVPLVPAAATLWVGLEVLRGEVVFDGYAWFLLGHPLIEWPGLARPIGATGGAYFMSLWGVLLACVVWESLCRRRPSLWLALPLVLWAGAWLAARGGEREAPALRVGVVQTNVPQSNKVGWSLDQRMADMRRMQDLTREASRLGAQMIVWPETMFPGFLLDGPALDALEGVRGRYPEVVRNIRWFVDGLIATQTEAGVPMLVGAVGQDGVEFQREPVFDWRTEARFNSVFEVRAGRVGPGRYDKRVLTPFGEVMPYISAWPWLEKQLLALGAGGMTFDLARGQDAVRFEAGGRVIATPICFEATNSGAVRSHVRSGPGPAANLIINLTNDGWFGSSDSTRRHHMLCARWRAVELGMPLVRVANTGMSCLVDPEGRVRDAMPGREDGARVFEVPGGYRMTPFRAAGNLWTWLPASGAILLVFSSYWRRGRRADG